MDSHPIDSSTAPGEDSLLRTTLGERGTLLGHSGGPDVDTAAATLVDDLMQRNFELARRVNELEVALANLSVRTPSPLACGLRRAATAPVREIRRVLRRLQGRRAGA